MAMSLALGRERVWRAILASVLHIVGAALGGAVVGGMLGALGSFLSLSLWRAELIIAMAIFALWQSLSPRPAVLGLHRQVPRVWVRTMSPELRFFLWECFWGVVLLQSFHIQPSLFFSLPSSPQAWPWDVSQARSLA